MSDTKPEHQYVVLFFELSYNERTVGRLLPKETKKITWPKFNLASFWSNHCWFLGDAGYRVWVRKNYTPTLLHSIFNTYDYAYKHTYA